MATQINRFAAAGFDDSDDEPVVKPQNKTQKKKEERKITDKPVRVAGAKTMEAGGFEFVSNQPSTRGREGVERGRGGRGGRGDRGRGGRGARGGDRRGAPRGGRGRGGDGERRGGDERGERKPAPQRLDADGNPIQPVNRPRRENGPGKEGDRKDGTGRGRRDNKRDGHGRGNTGTDQAVAYKQKGANTEEGATEEAKVPEEEKKPVVEPVVMETIGVSIDDFLSGKTKTTKKAAREAEGVKSKVESFTASKVHQGTILKKAYATHAKSSNSEVNQMFGFGAIKDDDDEDVPSSRGGRGGRGDRRGRGGRGDRRGGNEGGGRRQNAKQALKVTDDDFPTL